MRLAAFLIVLFLTSPVNQALTWWDEGHMQIAYVAYQRLNAPVKDKVDALLKLNADYSSWTAGAPDAETARAYAFVHAATWADDIKMKNGYVTDRADGPDAGKNIGYVDKNRHPYWHFKDLMFSPDGTPLATPDPVDAVTQLNLMIAALPASSGASDDVRSYDLVWMLHLIGDLHQPLHAVQRHTAQIPAGDRGGNSERVIPATGETLPLHSYWDRFFGGYSSVFGAIFDAKDRGGLMNVQADAAAAQILDPDKWVKESFELAKEFAYAPPVGTGTDAVELTREYETNARNVARTQAALAAARMANLLNDALK
jgi:hypothetical protein